MIQLDSWDVESGRNGAVLVRVHSPREGRDPLPDAVFTFRVGDPQYEHWKRMLDQRLRATRMQMAAAQDAI